MMRYFLLCWRLLRINLLRETAYRANFLGQLLQSFLSLGSGLLGLEVVTSHGQLNGWDGNRLLLLLGIYEVVGGVITLVIQPNMQQLMREIHQGTLDFALLKPVDAQLLISLRRVEVWKLSDIIIGLGVLFVALVRLGTLLTWTQTLVFLVMLATGCALIYSFWLILATCAFWLVKVENILVIFQDLYQAGRWPVTVYPDWLRWTLTFLVPVAVATTLPAQALLGELNGPFLPLTLLLLPASILLSRWFWLRGLRHYTGASA